MVIVSLHSNRAPKNLVPEVEYYYDRPDHVFVWRNKDFGAFGFRKQLNALSTA